MTKNERVVYMEGTCRACGHHTVVHKDTRLCVLNGCLRSEHRRLLEDEQALIARKDFEAEQRRRQ